MADPPVTKCEICGKSPVEKLLYPVAVHFKGSGFYATDYGRGRKREGSKDGSSDGAAPASESSSSEKSGPKESKEPTKD